MVVAAGRGVVVAGGGGGGGGAAAVGGCGGCCFEADPESQRTEERWVYKGAGQGSYSQVANMEMVGAGRGEFEKEKSTTVAGYRLRVGVVLAGFVLLFLAIFLPIAVANNWWGPGYTDPCSTTPQGYVSAHGGMAAGLSAMQSSCCAKGYSQWCVAAPPRPDQTVVHDQYYTQVKDVKVPHTVAVPIPPPPRKVITHTVHVHTHAFDCDGDASGDMSMWSSEKKRYCCYLRGMTCHTKVTYRPHYHTITHYKQVTVPVHVPIPAPPPQVINHVVNDPIHDPPQVIKVPVPGKPNYVPKYVHQKHYVPVKEPSPPQYHSVPVPVPVKDPGQVIKVPVPLPPQTVVHNKVIYKTRHVKVQHIYDCNAGFNNWNSGWSSAKKSWCCSHESRGCPGDHSGSLTKTYVTHVTEGRPHTVYHTHHYVTHHVSHEYVPTHVVHHWGGSGHFGGDSYGSGSGATTVVHHYSGSGSSGSWGGSSGGSSHSFGGSGSFSGSHSIGGSGSFSHSFSMSSSSDGGHARRLQEIENGEVDGGDSTIEGGDSTIEGGDSSIGGEAIEGGDSTIEGGDSTVEGEAIEGGDSTIEGGEGTIGGEAIEGGDGTIEGEEGTIGGEAIEGGDGTIEGGEGTIGGEAIEGGDGTIEGGEGTIGGEAIEGGDGTIEGGEGTIGGEAIEGGDSSIGGETIGGGDAGEGEFVGGGDSSVGGGIIDGDNGYPPYVGDGGSATVDGGDSGLGGEFVENGGGLGGETIGDGSSGIGGGFVDGHFVDGNWVSGNSWTNGMYGHYEGSTFVHAHFPHDAWYGGHYGHYTPAGTFVSMTYPHDAWVNGHYGHYDHSGSWIEVHHVGGHYHVHGHYHPVDATHYATEHAVAAVHPEHVIEKNFYEVRTKTHVIHDPVTIPGKVIHKQVTLPAKAVYNCMEGFHDWHHLWTEDQQKYCCYKVSRGCTTKIVKHLRYHTVVQNHNIPVPVPKPVPVHLPPPPPQVIKVPVHLPPPPRQVVKVPYPVREPAPEPKVITKVKYFKKPVPVPVVVHKTEKIPVPVKRTKYVKVPIPEPSPPHIVYHTKKIVSHAYDCDEGVHTWHDTWSHSKRLYCCWRRSIGCPHSHTIYHTHTVYHTKVVPKKVVMPPKIIYKDVTVHHTIDIDCNSGYSNWYYGWSNYKKHYCCSHEKRGCPGTWKGFAHGHIHVTVQKGVGTATGKIYDCQAGFNNWLHGWSDSKKKWCCGKEQKGCVKFHCDHDAVSTWGAEKRDWCCGNFQKGCAATTLSPLGCDTPCHHAGESSTCKERIEWASHHVFSGKGNACELAYSQIQVECDVCRSCTVQAAGCEVHAVAKDPYDCDAALNNFFRAWSPPKKQWCCNNRGKGCEGNSPPKVDPGAGMMWKHVQINGFWTWQVVAAAGGGVAAPPASLPYDCNVGVVNWKIGWSAPKKTWCCAHNKVGCPGSAGGVASQATHVTVHYTHGGVAAGGAAGAAAAGGAFHAAGGAFHAAGGSFHAAGGAVHHSSSYHVHHVVVHHDVIHHSRRLEDGGFDCAAGRASRNSWPQEKKDYCCKQDSVLCEE